MKERATLLIVLVGVAAACPPRAHAQICGISLPEARVSADTVTLGDAFVLEVRTRVAAGRTLFFPDTLPETGGVESLGIVRVDTRPAVADSTDVILEYPLIPFVVGIRSTPTFDVFSGEAGPGAPVVGSWDDVVAAMSARTVRGEPYDRVTVASRRVFVTTVLMLEDVVSGISPRPPADVVGGSWDLSSGLPALVLSILLIGLVSMGVRDWLDARAKGGAWEPGPVETPDVWRERALEQLDGVLSEGLHQSGRPCEFYEGLSEVVRDYVERFDDGWDRSLTATELMRVVSATGAWMDPGGLSTAMGFAEVVKFGKARPSPEKAEDDWRVVQGWVDASQDAPAFRALVPDPDLEDE